VQTTSTASKAPTATSRDIRNIRARLERWELDHLRALSTSLHTQLEEANTRAAEAESWAHTWWRNAECLQEELLLLASETGRAVGLTQQGDVMVVKVDSDQSPEHTPPAPGHPWPAQGGTYIGIAPAEGNLPARHLVVLDIEPSTKLTWANAVQWAQTHGNGARLPTQLEALFAFTTAKAAFKPEWHWTLTQNDRGGAFCQSFEGGYSSWGGKECELRVRACRGLALQTFTPLSLDPAAATTPSGA